MKIQNDMLVKNYSFKDERPIDADLNGIPNFGEEKPIVNENTCPVTSNIHKRWSSQANQRKKYSKAVWGMFDSVTSQIPNWPLISEGTKNVSNSYLNNFSKKSSEANQMYHKMNNGENAMYCASSYELSNQRISPFGRTRDASNFALYPKDAPSTQMNVYTNEPVIERNAMEYVEVSSNRFRCTKRKNDGVRISGRRFTTNSYNRKAIKEHKSYENNKNKTSNAYNISKLADLRPCEIQANTPEKHWNNNVFRIKPSSSHRKRRFTAYPPSEPISAQNVDTKMDPRYNIVTGSAMKGEVLSDQPAKPQQYLKSASLCQFHKKIFILTGESNRLPYSSWPECS